MMSAKGIGHLLEGKWEFQIKYWLKKPSWFVSETKIRLKNLQFMSKTC